MVLQTQGNKAMILAAGLGTRLNPLTEHRPKALVEWKGKALLEHVILKLKQQGFGEIIINIHHFPEMIMDFVKQNDDFGLRIVFSHEAEELLDTGGGIAKAAWFFDERPFLVYNVDVQCDIDLERMYRAHLKRGALATLAVKDRVTTRSLLMNREGYLKGWRDNRNGDTILVDQSEEQLIPIAFSAIHIMDPEIFKLFPDRRRFPITTFYLELAKSRPIYLYRHDEDRWTDMGKLESYT